MALGMFVNFVMFALGEVTAAEVDLLKTAGLARVVQTDEVEKVANTVVVVEAFGVAEVVTVAETSVEAAPVTEAVLGAVAGTGLLVEELVGTDEAVVWLPWAVEFVVGEAVADAVVAV